MRSVLRQVRQAALLQLTAGLSDGELLDRFITQREEAAFEALVTRHGPAVLGVCRRVLGNCHDAEDAFQATFLVLVRKAASVWPRDLVGNWLYGVACRTALRARAQSARRRQKEEHARQHFRIEAPTAEPCEGLRSLLDEELHRLPERLRAPVVLCDLDGLSRVEAARRLGWPVGTLSWRLAAARKALARRLSRRGVELSAGALTLALAQSGTSAAVAARLIASITQAAMLTTVGQAAAVGLVSVPVAALTRGVLKSMLLAQPKTAAAVACGALVLGAGTGGVVYQARIAAASPQAVQSQHRDEKRQEQPQASEELRALRAKLQQARQEAEAMRQLMLSYRQFAKDEQKRAEEALKHAQQQAAQADGVAEAGRQNAAKALYANTLEQAQADFYRRTGNEAAAQFYERLGKRHTSQQSVQDNESTRPLNERARSEESYRRRLDLLQRDLAECDARRMALHEAMRGLTEKHKREMDQSLSAEEARRRMLEQRGYLAPSQVIAPADKLDRILEKLERVEKRLDQLEREHRHQGADPHNLPHK
jgi:RNA polymerase sigma factor (sigma-70 family)